MISKLFDFDRSNDQAAVELLSSERAAELDVDEFAQLAAQSAIAIDGWLSPARAALERRATLLGRAVRDIAKAEGSLVEFARSYRRRGIYYDSKKKTWCFCEWAPAAEAVSLVGPWNDWDPENLPCTKDTFGNWFVEFPSPDKGGPKDGDELKVCLKTPNGLVYRLPSWARETGQKKGEPVLHAVARFPAKPFAWQHDWPSGEVRHRTGLRIYEAHVGMATERSDGRVGSFDEFREHVLPWICDLGYNAIQLMAVQEHSYYASFGYQVTSFFAPTARCGSPDSLRRLVDAAHGRGLLVLLDVVHSHASSNVEDGINQFDGSDSHLFHSGPLGVHPGWNSRLFNYGSWETRRFLLANVAYWLDEFRFDGFRFDGVGSMIYRDHQGPGSALSEAGSAATDLSGPGRYFLPAAIDEDALTYCALANLVAHAIRGSACVCIAEEVSGMPGTCASAARSAGLGFDYRLGMAIPDKWIELLKHRPDEDWSVSEITHVLTDRQHQNPTISYAESHDQALVGDKTIAFWLMDAEMYDGMTILKEPSPRVARGIALHKLIRLLTCALGGEGYLNFMGNEFGHPEWIDFPRPGNGWSHHYCRRQWSLARDHLLRYSHLAAFDKAMHQLAEQYPWLLEREWFVVRNEADHVVAFLRGPLLFCFNFHPTQSFPDYGVGVDQPGFYKCVLDSDAMELGGLGRLDHSQRPQSHPCDPGPDGKHHRIQIYIPSRVALVFVRDE